ncbi:MAG TPA: YdeI/OmpD-associated family protein [Pyrinomonadaceae bacterium]
MPTTTKRFRVELKKHENTEATEITIPFDVHKAFGARTRVPVRGTINGHAFRSSVFWMCGRYMMAVNKQMREGAGVKGGETITVIMERDDEPRVITPPDDFARALKSNKDARAAWDKLSYTHQKEYTRNVEEAKRPETRTRRIENAITRLAAGGR